MAAVVRSPRSLTIFADPAVSYVATTSTWRSDRARAGAGTLLEHSIHDLDLLEWMCGPLAVLSAHRDNLHGLEGIEDTVSVSFRFRAGGTGVLTSTWHDLPGRGSNRRFELFTERARFETEGNAAAVAEMDAQIGESQAHAAQFTATLDKAQKRFAALAKVEERHARHYQAQLDKISA